MLSISFIDKKYYIMDIIKGIVIVVTFDEMEGKLDFPYKFKELEPEETAELNRLYSSNINYRRVGPKGYLVLKPYEKDAANIYNMPLRTDDIFVAAYQRSGAESPARVVWYCGTNWGAAGGGAGVDEMIGVAENRPLYQYQSTTWTQELVWLLASNLDYETAEKVTLINRYSFLDQFMFVDENLLDYYVDVAGNVEKREDLKKMFEYMAIPASRLLATAASPRFIKTHLPMSLLPPNILETTKVVYVARDPRDVAVSSYHHAKLFKILQFPGDFKEFWNIFTKNLFTLTPFFEHIKEAWEMRNHPNMLFLFYEELSKDLPATVRRVANFLGKELTTEEMSRLCEHLKFENFKNNASVNYEELRELSVLAKDEKFIRKGKAGGWRDHFDEEMTQNAERWMEDNLRDTDLRFPSM